MFHAGCRICISDEKEAIEARLSQKVQYRTVALEFMNAFNCHPNLLEQSIGNHAKKHLPKELTKEEQVLLERVRKDEISIDEIQRFVRAKAVENMLMNPHRLKLNDVFRMENLLLRKEKMKQKRGWDYETLFSKIK